MSRSRAIPPAVRSVAVLVLGACAQFPTTSREQAAADGPNQTFQDELIDRLVGEWNLTRTIRGKELENTLEAKWVLHHQFLELHMKDVADPPAYESLVLIGYSRADQRYIAHWCDTWGGKFSSDGFGTRSGDSIEFEFHFPDGPFFNTFTRDPASDAWTFRMENATADGKRSLFGMDSLHRR